MTTAALLLWPVVCIIFFQNWSIAKATAASLLGGYLLLPEGINFDLPLLPAFGKGTIPALSVLFLVWIASNNPSRSKEMLPGWLPKDRLVLIFLAMVILGAFGTALTNGNPIRIANVRIEAMGVYDGFSLSLSFAMSLIPFVVARKVLASPEAQMQMIKVLIWAVAAYSLLALWEVRMSPQLNRTVYGFFPHSWGQHVRNGGFRPLVFLGHGLKLGIVLAMAAVAAISIARAAKEASQRKLYLALFCWLFVTIFFSKVLGALVITTLLAGIVFFAPRSIQRIALISIAIMVVSFPILRNVGLVPVDGLVQLAQNASPERAQSLEFRFENEDILLDRAREKPVFGWGGWGRNRVYDENGEDISVTDGRWVILFGQGGWTRYVGEMGLLCWCILAVCLRPGKIDGATLTLMFILAANIIDAIPNSGLSSLTWMVAGALIGRLEYVANTADPDEQDGNQDRPLHQYSRQLGPPKERIRPPVQPQLSQFHGSTQREKGSVGPVSQYRKT